MSQPKQKELVGSVRQKMLLDYSVYMGRCVPQDDGSPHRSPVQSAESSPTAGKKVKLRGVGRSHVRDSCQALSVPGFRHGDELVVGSHVRGHVPGGWHRASIGWQEEWKLGKST